MQGGAKDFVPCKELTRILRNGQVYLGAPNAKEYAPGAHAFIDANCMHTQALTPWPCSRQVRMHSSMHSTSTLPSHWRNFLWLLPGTTPSTIATTSGGTQPPCLRDSRVQ